MPNIVDVNGAALTTENPPEPPAIITMAQPYISTTSFCTSFSPFEQYWVVNDGTAPSRIVRTTGTTGTCATTNTIIVTSASTTPSWYYMATSNTTHWSNERRMTSEQLQAYYAEQERLRKIREFKSRRSVRSSIKRAVKLMANVGFEEEARIFLKGDSIEVSHPDSVLKFVLTRPKSIIDKTLYPGASTPYKLSLYTKTDIHVSDLCVYMRDTPVLDQVLAVALFIKSGDEEHILRKANWFSRSREPFVKDLVCSQYPQLAAKF